MQNHVQETPKVDAGSNWVRVLIYPEKGCAHHREGGQ